MATVALHHILVKSPVLAKELLQELQLGADFGQLAREYSCCPSANNEGFAGFHLLADLDEELVRAMYDTQEEYSPAPIKTQFGYHLVKPVRERRNSLLIDE